MKAIINNVRGKSLPSLAVYQGYLFLVVGLFKFLTEPLSGLMITFLGGLLCFTFTGIQIDLNDNKYRVYTSFFGLKTGNWKSLEIYKEIAILKSLVNYKSYYKATIPLTSRETYYDIYLLDKTHRKKLLIKRLINKDQSILDAESLASLLKMELTTYKPTLSAKSIANKRR